MKSRAEILSSAELWAEHDFDPSSKAELLNLIDLAKHDVSVLDDLADRFSGPLEFGTAGLRAELGAGMARMNRATVAKAAWGLSTWMLAKNLDRLVIGHDARRGSAQFALDTAEIASALGIKVFMLEPNLPTPVLAFAVKHLQANAGVMVTASHNPAKDNGYKVYDQTGSQIIGPTDKEIAHLISVSPLPNLIKRGGSFEVVEVLDSYLTEAIKNVNSQIPKDLKIAYTALHGVGSKTFLAACAKLGITKIFEVKTQANPDPEFPTVAFPNPEEAGALDQLLQIADQHGADIAIANDPDADRMGVAIPTKNGWRKLSGDEIGVILGWFKIEKLKELNLPFKGSMATSIVSSSLLSRIAEKNNIDFNFTLTGFKHIGRIPKLIYGYEEALGYAVDPQVVGDKDGITAALLMIELVGWLKRKELSIDQVLIQIQSEFGPCVTDHLTLRFASVLETKYKFEQVVANPPTQFGSLRITRTEDLKHGLDGLPATTGIYLQWAAGRVIIRPSGTEPKLKCYIEVSGESTLESALEQVAVVKGAMSALFA